MIIGDKNLTGITHLRFGILCNGISLHKWQAKSIRLLIKNNIHPVLLIVDDKIVKKKSFYHYLLSYPYSKFLFRIYQRFFIKPEAKKTERLNDLLEGIPVFKCTPEVRGISEYFTQNDIDKIKSHNLDFILRFGFNIIRGEILSAAKYGIWSFHHDDEQKFRGGPPGFWEIYYNNPVNGVILQKLSHKLDGGIILKKGYFKTTKHSYKGNLDHILAESSIFPLQVCRDILNGNETWLNNTPVKTDAKIHYVPGNLKMALFLLKLLFNKILFHFNELFKAEKWNIGIIKMSPAELLTQNAEIIPNWCPEPPNDIYYADPFAIEKKNEIEIYFEYFNYKIGKGNISKILYNKTSNTFFDLSIVIEKEFHISYPYIFNDKNMTYFIPETANADCIQLYKLINSKLVLHKRLIKNITAIDSTVFYYQSKWWIFFTKKENSATHLDVYYSDKPDGDYQPHKNNPVKSDIRSARAAGNVFQYNNELYRPSQDCSKTYGGRIAINKITQLTDTTFKEVTVKHIHPFKNTTFTKGVHTMAITDNYIVFDAKKMVFSPANFTSQLKVKWSRLFNQ